VADRPRALESLVVRPDPDFWRGKRVLLTGHTGFKGAWLALWLQQLGAQVTGIALAPAGPSNLFEQMGPGLVQQHHLTDICDAPALTAQVRAARPDIVLHLAAQALVRASYLAPLQTLNTNIMGTAHLLDALRDLPDVRVAVMVTTDKVYRNVEQAYPYRETDALGGHDPYSASKAASEAVIASYRDAFLRQQGVAVASARAGNVIGGGDWAPDRIIPDAVRAWQQGQPLQVRSPEAVRPWQHVLEPLAGYLRLAQCLWDRPELAGAYNFGPASHEAATVRDVVEMAAKSYGTGKVHYQNNSKVLHEATWLALETAKARTDLGIQPHWSLPVAVDRTLAWYRAQQAGAEARALCLADIAAYCADREPTQP
jgi:CDP-glucose 4,6-dehydratase